MEPFLFSTTVQMAFLKADTLQVICSEMLSKPWIWAKAREDVSPFLRDSRVLDIWSREFYMSLLDRPVMKEHETFPVRRQ